MISAIFAVDEKGGMGYEGSMPWPRNKEDMMWFKSMTQGHAVVMGHRTWKSSDMPIPLPGRVNVLITNEFYDREDIVQFRGEVTTALKHLEKKHAVEQIFVIGGPIILNQAKPVIEKVYLTRIPGEYTNDTFIDINEFLTGFELVNVRDLGTCKIEEYEKCNNI